MGAACIIGATLPSFVQLPNNKGSHNSRGGTLLRDTASVQVLHDLLPGSQIFAPQKKSKTARKSSYIPLRSPARPYGNETRGQVTEKAG